jgi:hypothetical protein
VPHLERVPTFKDRPCLPLSDPLVYIGSGQRSNKPRDGGEPWGLSRSMWAVPFQWPEPRPARQAVENLRPMPPAIFKAACAEYEAHVRGDPVLMGRLRLLVGKTLVCWCHNVHTCHGNVLVDLVREWLYADVKTEDLVS